MNVKPISKKTLVFGASLKTVRHSNKAVKMLLEYNHEVLAVGGREGTIDDVKIQTGHPEIKDLDTITLYMGEDRQEQHIDYLLGLRPKRIIFNPGAENITLWNAAKKQGIDVLNACTLVMLKTEQF